MLVRIYNKVEGCDKVSKDLKTDFSTLSQTLTSQFVSIKKLETQLVQISTHLNPRQNGDFSSNTISNLKNNCWVWVICCTTTLNKALLGRQPKPLFLFFYFFQITCIISEGWEEFGRLEKEEYAITNPNCDPPKALHRLILVRFLSLKRWKSVLPRSVTRTPKGNSPKYTKRTPSGPPNQPSSLVFVQGSSTILSSSWRFTECIPQRYTWSPNPPNIKRPRIFQIQNFISLKSESFFNSFLLHCAFWVFVSLVWAYWRCYEFVCFELVSTQPRSFNLLIIFCLKVGVLTSCYFWV